MVLSIEEIADAIAELIGVNPESIMTEWTKRGPRISLSQFSAGALLDLAQAGARAVR
jgi:hypothetical protein